MGYRERQREGGRRGRARKGHTSRVRRMHVVPVVLFAVCAVRRVKLSKSSMYFRDSCHNAPSPSPSPSPCHFSLQPRTPACSISFGRRNVHVGVTAASDPHYQTVNTFICRTVCRKMERVVTTRRRVSALRALIPSSFSYR